ncbi:hypothetical protein HK096_000202, partial [Nowakowskiella sp. JEL0078]
YGSITILFQKDVGGLEALLRTDPKKDPVWVSVPPIPGTVVVNTGDLMEYWTSGFLKSTVHRVVSGGHEQAQMKRYSIPYFMHPWTETRLDPIPSRMIADFESKKEKDQKEGIVITEYAGSEQRKEEIITAHQHLMMRLQNSYL